MLFTYCYEYCYAHELFVCLSVCLFVELFLRSRSSETARLNFTNFVRVACGRGSGLLWRHCDAMYFRFVDDVMLSPSGRRLTCIRER